MLSCFKKCITVVVFCLSSSFAFAGVPTSQQTTLAPILRDVMPTVVNIKTVHPPVPTMVVDPNTGRQFPVPQRDDRGGLASGVIVDANKGYVLTNFHAINGAREISVVLSDGRNLPAKPVGGDPLSDVAVIQIPPENLTQIKLGNSDNLQVGDFVVAIGNPFGLNHSVTSGIVSALGRSELGIEGIEDFIQTDASINPGNSGGALIDMQGNLIGINTALINPGRDPGNIGIGLAIPINMAHSIMLQLIEFGEVRRGIMGVSVQTVTHDFVKAMGMKQAGGALIANVAPSSLAEKAGLKPGDVVIALNDKPIKSGVELRNKIGLVPIGNKVHITLIRNKKEQVLTFELSDPRTLTTPEAAISPLLDGVELGSVIKTMPGHGDVKGLEVHMVAPGSPASRAKLHEGDVIVSVNHLDVTNLKELEVAIKEQQDVLLVRFLRGRDGGYTVLTMPNRMEVPKK
jgi:Do/DeqQ family serine protease